jgi:hypothetical protein
MKKAAMNLTAQVKEGRNLLGKGKGNLISEQTYLTPK